ncbi:MAG: hypothetical protein V1858_02150 [Candidatus Gottesmanbacteria bacterium]
MASNPFQSARDILRRLKASATSFIQKYPTPASFVSSKIPRATQPSVRSFEAAVKNTPVIPLVPQTSLQNLSRIPSYIGQQLQRVNLPTMNVPPVVKAGIPITQLPEQINAMAQSYGRTLANPGQNMLETGFNAMPFIPVAGVIQKFQKGAQAAKILGKENEILDVLHQVKNYDRFAPDLQISAINNITKTANDIIPDIIKSKEMKYLAVKDPNTWLSTVGKFIEDRLVGAKNPRFDLGLSTQTLGKLEPQVVKSFVEQGVEKTPIRGLLSESPAQTSFRRKAGLAVKDVYQKAQDFVSHFTDPKGEFNNIPPEKKVNILDYLRTPNRVLDKIGLGDEAKLLRKNYDTYKLELPKEINKITEWSKRVPKTSNKRIFQWLDGDKIDLNLEELKVAGEIKTYLKDWAEKLNLPKDRQISDYITHLFPRGAVEKEFDPEVAKLINSKVVKSVYDPFLQKRTNKPEYLQDTWKSLDAYTKRATRKFFMDPALERVAAKAESLPMESYNYVKGRIARINMQPTDIDTLFDNLIKITPVGYRLGQRPLTVVTQTARQLTSTGLLGLNPGTALRNLEQSTNTYATIGEKNFGIGLMKYIQNMPKYILGKDSELDKLGIFGNDIIQDRNLSAVKTFWQKVSPVFYYMFDQAEKFNRAIAFYGGKAQGLAKGLSEEQAIAHAKDVVAKTQFLYDTLDTPAALQSDIMKTAFQFGKYPLAQSEFLAEMVKNKNIAGSVRWVASNLLFIAAAGKVLGLEPKDMFPQFRFGTPPTLQAGQGALEVAMSSPNKYGQPADPDLLNRIKENPNLIKGLINYIPGGGQITKSIQGIQAYSQGSSQTATGRERFNIEQNVPNLIKSALFGQYATPEGRTYVENLGKSNSQILYENLKKLPPEQAAAKVSEMKTKNPSGYKSFIDYMNDRTLKITSYEKNTRNLTVKDGARAKSLVKQFNSKKTGQEKADLYKRLKQLGVITTEIERQLNAARQAGVLK